MGEPAWEFDVGVVGYGPVGAMLANLLGRCGLTVGIFERESGQYGLPRAAHFDGEVMRVFQSAGLADALLPMLRVNAGMRFVNAAGELLINWPRPQEVGPQGWHPSYRFHQPDVEAVLRRGVTRFAGHREMFRADVFALDQRSDGVAVRYEDLTSGTYRIARCGFVVGCDGARSTARRFMDAALDDLGSHQRWLVVDVVLAAPVAGLDDFTVQYCDPARPTTVARGVGLRRRWEFMLMPDDDAAAIARPDAVWNLLARWINPGQAEIERAVVYTFHSAIARSWRSGRLLLAGDAAHQTPPFLGQGLCAGIRDAANLAWKLAAVVRGEADDALLESYEAERSPHTREYIELAVRLGGLIQTTDPGVAARRDREMTTNPHFMQSIAPRLGSGLHRTAPPPAGTLSKQVRLSNGTRMDDAVGQRFAVLATAALWQALPASGRMSLEESSIIALPGEGLDWLAELGTGAVLIRPDRYVLACADTPEALRDLLAPFSRMRHPETVA